MDFIEVGSEEDLRKIECNNITSYYYFDGKIYHVMFSNIEDDEYGEFKDLDEACKYILDSQEDY